MNPDNLRRLLQPRHIAFIGGNDADFSARQCAAQFDGPVWGVNPSRDTLGGVRCFRSVEELPAAPDAVFLATPRAASADIVKQLADFGAGGVACFTAGYGELGKGTARIGTATRPSASVSSMAWPAPATSTACCRRWR